MIWSIAWRNVWRNKLRSLIVIAAVTIGLFGTLFMIALSIGMVDQRIDAAIEHEVSHIQIHHPKFMQDKSPDYFMTGVPAMVDSIRGISGVKAVSSRLALPAMASTAATGTGVMVNGIQPEEEKQVSKIYDCLKEGTYFEKEARTPLILISQKLATKMNAKMGSKIVITLQNMEGVVTYGLFRVGGIYKTSNTMYDEGNVFVRSADLADLTGFDTNNATEIAVLLDNTNKTDEVTALLQAKYSSLSVMPWKELQPMLLTLSSIMDLYSYILMIVILTAMAFGIINTMLMAILERIKEIGMLMAVGMSRKRIFTMIMLETIFLSVTGALIGMVVSYATIQLTGVHGLNFAAWSEGLESFGYSSLVYPVLYNKYYIALTLFVIVTAILSSVYPARKALRFKPAEAIRADT
ncbi:MAG: FtsX-like permease family protein [Bacteroidetes bacterium]|nr:FtsX-like permease family protein [Bacteroidota bacterium]